MIFSEQSRTFNSSRLLNVIQKIKEYNEENDNFRRVINPVESSDFFLVKKPKQNEVSSSPKTKLLKQVNQTSQNKET